MKSGTGKGWRVVGASVPGGSHRRIGLGCQDAHTYRDIGRNILIAAVADGAGSSSCSEIGAALASKAAVGQAIDLLNKPIPMSDADWETFLANCLQAARQDVASQAEALEVPVVNLATTLLLAVVTPGRLAAAQIGDGALVVRHRDDSYHVATHSRPQEYVNETTFLTSPTYLEQVQFVVQSVAVNGLALFTDGLQMLALKMPESSPHVAFFAPLLNLLTTAPSCGLAQTQLEQFLLSPRVAQRTDDDLTLVLAVRE